MIASSHWFNLVQADGKRLMAVVGMSHHVRNSLFASRRPRKEPAGLDLLCHLQSDATMIAAPFPWPLAAVKQQYTQGEGYKWQKFSLLFQKVFSIVALSN